jgi:hypothetical protein
LGKDAIKLFFWHFILWPERMDHRVIDEDIDVAISEFDRSVGHFASAGCISRVGENEICLASCGANFVDCLVPAFRVLRNLGVFSNLGRRDLR